MAVHLSIGRKLSLASIAVLGLAALAWSVPDTTGPGLGDETGPGVRFEAAAPRPSDVALRAVKVRADISAADISAADISAEVRSESQAGTGARHEAERAAPAERPPGADPIARLAAITQPAEPPVSATTSLAAAVEPARPSGPPAELAVPAERPPGADPIEPVEQIAALPPAAVEPLEPAESLAVAAPASQPAEAQPAEAQPVEAQPAEARPAEARPVEVQPAEAQPAISQPTTAQPSAFQVGVTVARLMTEPRDSAGPAARRNNMAPIPVRAPRPADAGAMAAGARTMFERGVAIQVKQDAQVYITSRNIPRNDRLLEAYNADRPNGGRVQTTLGEAAAVPGLLGIAAQAHRAQGGTQTYSLADAMRDAIWRKKTAARLKSLTTAQNTCASGATRDAPSIGLLPSC